MTQRFTHSRSACCRACPRRHYLRYELGLSPVVDGYALRVGSGFHSVMEDQDKGIDPAIKLDELVDNPYDLAIIAAMADGHNRRWELEPLEVVATELEFDLPLINPDTGKATPVWTIAGKIDRIIRLPNGQLALVDYKTTSLDFSPGSEYWTKLQMDYQPSIYLNAARTLGYAISRILYDVTVRPSLRPLKATPEEKRKYKKTGELYANQRDVDESPEEYAVRVATWLEDHKDTAYARIEIARLDQDLQDSQREIWMQQLTIRAMQRGGPGAWYRNPDACFLPYHCSFLPICQNRDLETRTPDGFVRRENVHPELTTAI